MILNDFTHAHLYSYGELFFRFSSSFFFFFLKDPAPPKFSPLPHHAPLPIYLGPTPKTEPPGPTNCANAATARSPSRRAPSPSPPEKTVRPHHGGRAPLFAGLAIATRN